MNLQSQWKFSKWLEQRHPTFTHTIYAFTANILNESVIWMTMAVGICSNDFENVGSNVNRTEMNLYILYTPLHNPHCILNTEHRTMNTVHKHKYHQQAPHEKSIKLVLPGSYGRNVLFFFCFFVIREKQTLRLSSSHRRQCRFFVFEDTHTHTPYCEYPILNFNVALWCHVSEKRLVQFQMYMTINITHKKLKHYLHWFIKINTLATPNHLIRSNGNILYS